MRRILEDEFGVVRCLQAVYDLLHRLGFEPLRPGRSTRRPIRRRIQKRLPERVAQIEAARPGERVEVWFEDEARFGQKGTLTSVWAQRGTRPRAPKQAAYGNLHVLTAVCPASGRAEGLISPQLNASVVQTFLDQLSATIPTGAHVVWFGVVWCGTGPGTTSPKPCGCPTTERG